MKVARLSDIINDFNEATEKNEKVHSKFKEFWNLLYVFQKSKENEEDCFNELRDKAIDISMELTIGATKTSEKEKNVYFDRFRRNFYRFEDFGSENYQGRSRKDVIFYSYIISSLTGRNGKDIANDLLTSLGYPILRVMEPEEFFHIYSLNNGLSYIECVELYNEYSEYEKINIDKIPLEKSFIDKPTTFFFSESEKLPKITDGNKEEIFKKAYQLLNSDKRTVSKKVYKFFKNSVDSVAERRESTPEKIIFDLILYYTFIDLNNCNLEKHKLKEIEKSILHKDNISIYLKALASDKFDDFRYKETLPIIKKGRKDTAYKSFYDFYSEKKSITRECLILFLIYCGCYSTSQIDAFISSRYAPLNEKVFFDRYAMTVNGFEVKDEKLIFRSLDNEISIVINDSVPKVSVMGNEEECTLKIRNYVLNRLDFPDKYKELRLPVKDNFEF